MAVQQLAEKLQARLSGLVNRYIVDFDEITLEIDFAQLIEVALILRDEKPFLFNMLIDLCVVDYLQYGQAEWATDETTTTGFSRGVEPEDVVGDKPRFAVVYHLLSTREN